MPSQLSFLESNGKLIAKWNSTLAGHFPAPFSICHTGSPGAHVTLQSRLRNFHVATPPARHLPGSRVGSPKLRPAWGRIKRGTSQAAALAAATAAM